MRLKIHNVRTGTVCMCIYKHGANFINFISLFQQYSSVPDPIRYIIFRNGLHYTEEENIIGSL